MKDLHDKQFAVLGLGRFGMSIAHTLSNYDANVMACDLNPALVREASTFAVQALQADISDEHVLEQLGLGNFDVVVIATGQDFEAAIIATSFAKEKGVGYVMVRATSSRQKKILESLGADRVVLPEVEMGSRIAMGLVHPDLVELFHGEDKISVSKMPPMEYWIGKSIIDAQIRKQYGVTILGIRRANHLIAPVHPSEVIQAEDSLIVLENKLSN